MEEGAQEAPVLSLSRDFSSESECPGRGGTKGREDAVWYVPTSLQKAAATGPEPPGLPELAQLYFTSHY